MTQKQRIAFLYLHTGGGHISGARALSGRITELYPDNVECLLKDGFEDNARFAKAFFEKGYAITSNYFESGYVATYQLTKSHNVLGSIEKILKPFVVHSLADYFRQEGITKVVCLHHILTPFIRSAIDRTNKSIPLITVVMDPFTAHPIWFYEKQTNLIVFSEGLIDVAIKQYGFDANKVHFFPLMLSKKFDVAYSADEKAAARIKHGIPLDKKVILLAGGGEGLKKAKAIVDIFIKTKFNHHLVVVCGKNALLKTRLESLVANKNFKNISIFGFVDFMPDLMNIADCVITKGGPATVMETLSIGKPLILSSYVRGQEFGNMLYVVKNQVGWYLPKPVDVVAKVNEIVSDEQISNDIAMRIKSLNIKNGLDDIVKYIYDVT